MNETPEETATTEGYEGWAVVELMGHRSHGGYVRPWRLAGHEVLRVDVPDAYDKPGDGGPPAKIHSTRFYGGSAIFCLTPATEQAAREYERQRGQWQPPQALQLPDGSHHEEERDEPISPGDELDDEEP